MVGPRIEVECGQGQRLCVLSFRVPNWTASSCPQGNPSFLSGSFLPVGVLAVCPAPPPRGVQSPDPPCSHVTSQLTGGRPAVGRLPQAPGKGRGRLRALSPRRRGRNGV